NFPDGMLWRFENVDETSYKIIPKTGESPDLIRADYVLATSTSSSSNNDNLKQGKYIGNNGSYRDEWYIVDNNSYIDYVVVSLCSIKSNDQMHEHDKCFSYFVPYPGNSDSIYNRDLESDFHRAGFKNVLVKSNTSLSYAQAVNMIRNSNVFVIRSHGDAEKVNTSNEVLATYVVLDETNNIKLYSNSDPCFSIDSGSGVLPSNDENDYFSNVDLALFIDCKTAAGAEIGNTHNLPAKLVEQGATTAIGFSQEIVCKQGDLWMKFFFQYFLNGKSVEQSIQDAMYEINAMPPLDLNPRGTNYESSGLCSIAVYGDTSLCIDDIRR
nr:hypothetical protein [Clostridia bacterium]